MLFNCNDIENNMVKESLLEKNNYYELTENFKTSLLIKE